MATQYTPILQLALPVTGELNGTWGDVVNDNITSMVEEAIAGLATISTWTANSHTLTTVDGLTDEARCAMIVAQTGAGGTALTAAGNIICPARTKLYVVSNQSTYQVTIKTAAGTGVAVAAGDTTFVFCDGTNVLACVTQIVNGHITGNLTVDGTTTLNDTATTETILPAADNTYDLGSLGASWRNLYIDGTAAIATISGTTGNITTVNSTTVDTTNIEVTNIKAKDGTASATIADATGVMTISSLAATTADINGGTIDNTTIGATTPTTGVFTQVDITAQGDLRLQDTTGGEYVALQAPGTLASSYTLTLPVDDGTSGQALVTDGSGNLSWSTAASGDVYGPASATDTAVALFDGTTGKLIKNSGVTIDGSNNVSGVAQLNATTVDTTNIEVTNIKAKDGTAAISIADTTGVVTGSTPQVISVNSSSDALRITQTGSGNALLVEDSANPDSTPFVVTQFGRVLAGSNTAVSYGSDGSQFLQVNGAYGWGTSRWSNDTGGSYSSIAKSRSATIGTYSIVSSGDSIGGINYFGDDGVGFIKAAAIEAYVDGTPGTNDMPGRLVFSTTADGASSPTERMRIDNAGRLGIGTGTAAGYNINIGQAITGATTTYALINQGTINSGVTVAANIFTSAIATQAATFNLANIRHFYALNTSIGAGSTVTNQFGFHAESSLTGATNNFGFYSNIASGTGRYNFYAAGSADNYFAGNVGIGSAAASTNRLLISGNATGGTTTIGVLSNQTIQSDVTAAHRYFQANTATAASAFTVTDVSGYAVFQASIGAGSTVTNQYGFNAASSLTGAVNNFGFYSNIAVNTGCWNFYANGTAPNYFAGNVGIGTTSLTIYNLNVAKNITGGTAATAIVSNGVIQSDVTSEATYYVSYAQTAAAAFTNANLRHYYARQGTFGAGSAVTNQFGFYAENSLTGASNNYGFYSNIAAGTGRWNFYAAGSAANYFAGDMQFAKTVTAAGTTGAQTINKTAGTVNFAAAATSLVVTNSLVTANSIIVCTVGTDDSTMKSVSAVAGAGSFTLYANAAATAETRVNFIVIN